MEEYNMENNVKTGHPVLGILLALLGIGIALLFTFLTGVIGGGIALLLGVLAVVLGVKARKGGKGIGAIVLGVIAIVLALLMTFSSIATFSAMRSEAEKAKPGSLIAKYTDKPYLGVVGILMNLPTDEASVEELMNEINELQAMLEQATENK
jgi:Flp pilus assembly protein protease CpaA